MSTVEQRLGDDFFTPEQRGFIAAGRAQVHALEHHVEQALVGIPTPGSKQDYYLVGPTGTAKTTIVERYLKKYATDPKIRVIKISGVKSSYSFVMQLAVCLNKLGTGERLVIWVDDCNLFSGISALNMMLGALDPSTRLLVWDKDVTGDIARFQRQQRASPDDSPGDEALKNAFERFLAKSGTLGLELPTNHVTFLFTTNMDLARPANNVGRGSKMRETMIRSRVKYYEFNVAKSRSLAWGWNAAVVLDRPFPGIAASLTEEQRGTLMAWQFANWDRLNGSDLRIAQDYAEVMIAEPKDFEKTWAMMLEPVEA